MKTDKPSDNNSSDKSDDTDFIRLSAYRLHQLANKLISAQEDVRKHISIELHDGLGQTLSALKYQVESAIIASNSGISNDAILNEILENVTFALSELRNITTNLRPSKLDALGILMGLKLFAYEYNNVYTDLKIDMQINLEEDDIPDKNKSVIYRIVQESMNNIAKHSNANNMYLRLTKSKGGILLRITDDGTGFDLKKVKQNKKSGLGLNSMEERAIESGATFSMSSKPLSGTTIKVFWSNN